MARYSVAMKRVLVLVLLAVCSVAAASEVYRWVDANGQIHYSDRPHEGAETIVLPSAQTYSTPARQPVRRLADNGTQASQGEEQETEVYKTVEIISPAQDQVLFNTGGIVNVSVRLQPSLRPGHILALFLDDRMVDGLTGEKRDAQLTEVFRGEHRLRAEVRNARGGMIAKGDSVTFTVKQTSTQNPNNPNAPAP